MRSFIFSFATRSFIFAFATICLFQPFHASLAASVADFYRGKQLTLIVGFGPGGGYDAYARLLARHIGAHIPGSPNVVVQNKPGAGSLVAANYLYNVAKKDGTVIGTFERSMSLIALLGSNKSVKFEPQNFNWLGSMSSFQNDAFLLFVKSNSKFTSAEQLRKATSKPLTVGGTASGAAANDVPKLLKDVLGLNIHLIPGYPDNNTLALAFERGEIDGDTSSLSSLRINHPDWLKNKKIRILIQFGRSTRHPDLPNVPTAQELAQSQEALDLIQMAELPYVTARPFVAPPGMPQDRAKALQVAFEATLKDKAFLSDAKHMRIDINGVTGEEVGGLIDQLSRQPKSLRSQLASILD